MTDMIFAIGHGAVRAIDHNVSVFVGLGIADSVPPVKSQVDRRTQLWSESADWQTQGENTAQVHSHSA